MFSCCFFFFFKTDSEPASPRDGVPFSTWHILPRPAAQTQNSQDQGEGGPRPVTGEKMCDRHEPKNRFSVLIPPLRSNLTVSFQGVENISWFWRQGLPPPNLHQTYPGQTNPFPGGHPAVQPLCKSIGGCWRWSLCVWDVIYWPMVIFLTFTTFKKWSQTCLNTCLQLPPSVNSVRVAHL